MAHYLFRLIRGPVVHENEFAACFFHFFTADCSKAVLQRCNSIARTDNNGQSSFSSLIHLQCLQLQDHGKPAKLRDSLHIPKSPFFGSESRALFCSCPWVAAAIAGVNSSTALASE